MGERGLESHLYMGGCRPDCKLCSIAPDGRVLCGGDFSVKIKLSEEEATYWNNMVSLDLGSEMFPGTICLYAPQEILAMIQARLG
jgi:hypothetical protein